MQTSERTAGEGKDSSGSAPQDALSLPPTAGAGPRTLKPTREGFAQAPGSQRPGSRCNLLLSESETPTLVAMSLCLHSSLVVETLSGHGKASIQSFCPGPNMTSIREQFPDT